MGNFSVVPSDKTMCPEVDWRPLTSFPLKILDNVSSIGSGAGIAASSCSAVFQRGLKFQTCTNTLNKFFLTIPGSFGFPHVYIVRTTLSVFIHRYVLFFNLYCTIYQS